MIWTHIGASKKVYGVVTILLWTVAEISLHAAIPLPEGLSSVGFVLVRSLVSLGIGLVIGSLIVGSFGKASEIGANE